MRQAAATRTGASRSSAQDLIDGVTAQLLKDEKLQQAARANDKANFRYVFEPALEKALVDRHTRHGDFIDKVFSKPEMLQFIQASMLEDVYRRFTKLA